MVALELNLKVELEAETCAFVEEPGLSEGLEDRTRSMHREFRQRKM